MDRAWLAPIVVGGLLVVLAGSFPIWYLMAYQVTVLPVDTEPATVEPVAVEELDEDSEALVDGAPTDRPSETTVYGSWSPHNRTNASLPAVISEFRLDENHYGALVEHEGNYYDVESPVRDRPLTHLFAVGGGIVFGTLLGAVGLETRLGDRSNRSALLWSAVGIVAMLAVLWVGNAPAHL